jgi:hypothetical protein
MERSNVFPRVPGHGRANGQAGPGAVLKCLLQTPPVRRLAFFHLHLVDGSSPRCPRSGVSSRERGEQAWLAGAAACEAGCELEHRIFVTCHFGPSKCFENVDEALIGTGNFSRTHAPPGSAFAKVSSPTPSFHLRTRHASTPSSDDDADGLALGTCLDNTVHACPPAVVQASHDVESHEIGR